MNLRIEELPVTRENLEAYASVPIAFTASSVLRSSDNMLSTISAGGSLSMASVAELMASVGSDCHLERRGMLGNETSDQQTADASIVRSIWSPT